MSENFISAVEARPEYMYFVIEEGSLEFKDCVKIGHSFDPLARPDGGKAFNPRRLRVVATLFGGESLEKEFHKKFERDKVGSGGKEWFRITSELIDFFREKLESQLTIGASAPTKSFGEPTKIAPVELGVVEPVPVKPVTRIDRIQPVGVVEAHPPKNPYSKVR